MNRLFRPAVFQGKLTKKSYFEGWYIKCLSDDLLTSIAFIPGVSLGKNSHAFIQVNTSDQETIYLTFPLEAFHYETDRFAAGLGNNCFSDKGIHLDYEQDGISLYGDLVFSEQHFFPSRKVSPGIMGPFSFIPFMECNHGVVSMRHRIRGVVFVNGKEYGFKKGTGYIEKDWGRSFPSSWIWMQANPFQNSEASFMLSIARIPWMGMSFTGVIGFLNVDDKVYRFATYLGHKIKRIRQYERKVDIIVQNRRNRLQLHIELGDGGKLIAPVNGEMTRIMKESLNSILHINLEDNTGNSIFCDTSHIAGLEISGNIDQLLKN